MRVSPSSRLVLAVLLVTSAILAAVVMRQPRPTDLTVALGPGASAQTTGGPSDETTSIAPDASGTVIAPSDGAGPPTTRPTTKPQATARPTARPTATACRPTDQDRFVYNPSRLDVLAACIRITGVVEAVRHEADGDLHILVALDPAYRHLLTAANQGEELGDLVVEPVCVRSVSQVDAVATCAADADPYGGQLPTVGLAVWIEGRYVLDLEHGRWAELHPLYRWGNR
jgi:hypothetical protein